MDMTINCKVHLKKGRNGRRQIVEGEEPAPEPEPVKSGNIPRLSKLMALAIRLDNLVKSREVFDYADLARLGQVSRARITQIMNLLLLAPDIQEEILFLPLTMEGRDSINERDLRPISAVPFWNRQRKMWANLLLDRGLSQ